MPGKLLGSVFHSVRVGLLCHQCFAQRTESYGVTVQKCELHL